MNDNIFVALAFGLALLGAVGVAGLVSWAADSFVNWFTSGE